MSFAILAATAFSLLLEASPSPSASPDATEALKHVTKDYPQLAPIVTGLVAAAGIIAYAVVPAENLRKLTESLQKAAENVKKIVATFRGGSEAPKQTDDLRQKLLKAIKRDVTQRLTDNLFNQFVIPLEMQDWNPAVGRAAALPLAPEAEAPKPQNPLLQVMRRLRIGKQPKKEIPPSRTLLDVFNQPDVAGKLLLLGEPGSGKTTLLLDLAKALLTQAEQPENKLIPVIFELSNWKDDRQPIDKWLIAQLKENYGIALAVSQQWLTTQQLLPLLDGLDELGMTRQIKCVEAINQFLEPKGKHYPHLVVCCRKEEYDEGKVTLHELNGAIYLQALTDAQVQQYLQAAKRPTLWQSIQAEPDLRRLLERQNNKPAVLRTPLLLKMLVVAYQGRTIRNTQELFDAYIDHQFELPLDRKDYQKGEAPYSRPKTMRYLVWLAKTLKAEAKTEFLIEKMQPTLLETAQQRWLYRLVGGLVGGLVVGLVVGLRADLQTRATPNQGIWQSAWNMLPVTLLCLPAGAILASLPFLIRGNPIHWLSLLPSVLGYALVFGFGSGGFPCVQHVALRVVLWGWGHGVIPWNYARFLKYTNDRRLIQQVGGRYRFIHDLLREHFAAMGE